MRALRLLLVVLALAWPALPGLGWESTAEAQSWTPKGRDREVRRYRTRAKKPARKPKPKPKPTDADRAPEPDEGEGGAGDGGERDGGERDGGAGGERDGGERDGGEGGERDGGAGEEGGGAGGEEGGEEGEDAGGIPAGEGGESEGDEGDGADVRIRDDLDDVGADVDFSAGDLASESADGETRASVTRLETFAMSFVRFAVDTVHDPVPESAGVKSAAEEVLSFRAHGRAEGTGRFGDRYKVKVAGRVFADLALDADTNIGVERYEAEMWDTYLDVYGDFVDLRFGKQAIVWGVADLLSPNDVVDARDLRRGFIERPEELRLPTLALSATGYDGPFSLQALWIPVAPVNRFELLEGDYALLGPNAATPVERRVGAIVSALADDPSAGPALSPILDIGASPDHGIETGEVGASVALRFRKLDLVGYFLWGHERNPRIRLADALAQRFADTDPDEITPEMLAQDLAALAASGVDAVAVDYPRRIHVGGAIAGRVEPIGLKLEAGYALEANTLIVPPGAGPLLSEPTPLPQLAVTASIDYDRGADLTLILEASHIQVYEVPVGRSVYQMTGDQLNLVGARAQWTPRSGPFSLRLLGFLDVDAPSYAVKPALCLSGHDNLSLEIAAAFFGGPIGSYGGIADQNDEILFTVQYGL